MKNINITFKRTPEWKHIEPIVPATKALPQWYKDKPLGTASKVPYKKAGFSIKACPAMFDSMIQGYILPLWTDLYVEPSGSYINGVSLPNFYWGEGIEGGHSPELVAFGSMEQTEGMPGADNTGLPAGKLNSPWLLSTAKGYSTLLVPPLNNEHAMFEAISGVIDSDIYFSFINIFFLWKGPADYRGVIKQGTPIAQMIPFKREEFQHEIGFITPKDEEERASCAHAVLTGFSGMYRKFFTPSQQARFR